MRPGPPARTVNDGWTEIICDMEHLLIYIAKVSVSAILFYLFIRILMERETQHEYIRGLWLGAMAASLVMPFIYFPVPDLFPERTEAAGSVNMVVSAGEMEIIGAEDAAERTVQACLKDSRGSGDA